MIEIQLNHGMVTLIDDCDSELGKLHWSATKIETCWYAVHYPQRGKGPIYLHREVAQRMGIDLSSYIVDHINLNGLDNRRSNLRPATKANNQQNQRKRSDNTSGYKGVHWHPGANRWRARIEKNGKAEHLGFFDNAEDAARAYDEAALRLFGEFARLNFPHS